MQKELKNEVIDIITQAKYDPEFIEYIKANFHQEFEMFDRYPYEGEYPDYAILEANPKSRMYNLLVLLIPLKQQYEQKGIPLNYFYDSIENYNYRVTRYYNQNGDYGLSESDVLWLRFVYFLEIFDLGSMRFQIFNFSYAEIERSGNDAMFLSKAMKKKIPEGTPVINMHINDNADISPESVDESIAIAEAFFSKYFPEHNYIGYVGRTWMFYPKTWELLGENSNIVKFAKRFELFAQSDNRWQALSRIYNTTDLDVIRSMDKKSSLQKKAYLNLDKLGVGAGIIYRDKI